MQDTRTLKLQTRRTLQPQQREAEHPFYTIVTCLLTLLFLLTVFAIFKAAPFGDRQIFQIDQFHQYSPFMAELRRKILSGESVMYSWNSGLGYNLWSSIGYYLASPFNIFLLVFPASNLAEAVLFITTLKLVLMAGAMQLFLSRAFRKAPLIAMGMGVAYALSTFVMAYSWNIMWMDVLLFLPLTTLGLVYVIRKEGRLLYVVSLALMIWSNFYLAGFACVFLALFYPVLWARFAPATRRSNKKAIVLSFLEFGVLSVLAAMLTAVLLIPTVLNLGLTSASDDKPPKQISYFQEFILILGRLYPFGKPAVMSGLPNIYGGLSLLLFLPLYIGNRRIPRAARVLSLLLLGFIFVSFNNNWLNFAWHGFHYPNSLNHRFAFLFTFLLMFMAFDGLIQTRYVRRGRLGAIAAVIIGGALILQLTTSTEETAAVNHTAVVVTMIAVGCLVAATERYLSRHRLAKRTVKWRGHAHLKREQTLAMLAMPLSLVMVLEAGANMFASHYERNKTSSYGPKDGYAAGVLPDELREVANAHNETNGEAFYRSEVVPPLTTNDGAIYDLHSLSIFASTYPEAPIKFFKNLGYRTNGVNSIGYRGSSVVMDTVLGIRYVMNKDNTWYAASKHRSLVENKTRITVFENHDALGLGVFTDQDPTTLSLEGMDLFTAQNHFYASLGMEEMLLERQFPLDHYQDVDPTTNEPLHVMGDGTGNYSFTRREEFIRFQVVEAGEYTLAWHSNDSPVDRVTLVKEDGDQTFAHHKEGLQELGHFEPGQTITLRFDLKEEQASTMKIYMVKLNEEAYTQSVQRLASRQMEMQERKGASFKGTIDAPGDGHVFFSLPFDPGWSFKVDGETVEVETIENALMALPVTAGSHTIEARFMPRGLKMGLVITAISLLAFIGLIVLERRRRKKVHTLRFKDGVTWAETAAQIKAQRAKSVITDKA